MKLIYSKVPPFKMPENAQLIGQYVEEKAACADGLVVAVGYASMKGLQALNDLVHRNSIKSAVLILGMYCIEGFPEGIYNTALRISRQWREEGIGQIRVTKSMKYHGKVYGFYKTGKLFSALVGSHNLGALAAEASNLRQYELSLTADSDEELGEISQHLASVSSVPISTPLEEAGEMTIIHEKNQKLNGVEGVSQLSQSDVDAGKKAQTDISFDIQLKVPGIPGDSRDYMKSNINKCYAKGRLNTRSGVVTERGWWETEIIVSSAITSNPKYPPGNVPFYIITDDGWSFLAHVSGDYNKNFESNGDLKILGYWLKGRLVSAGIVEPVDSPSQDLQNADYSLKDPYSRCRGVITYSKLVQYGRTKLTLTKTENKMADDDGVLRDVWMLSFLPDRVK